MWVTAEPLGVGDAKASLGAAVKDLDDYIDKGQLETGCCPNHIPAFWGRASRDILFEVGSLIGPIRPINGANFQIGIQTILQWAVQCVSEVTVRLLEHA